MKPTDTEILAAYKVASNIEAAAKRYWAAYKRAKTQEAKDRNGFNYDAMMHNLSQQYRRCEQLEALAGNRG